ncbi:MAG TPA: hypothetical protein VNT02_16600 [Burkholderiales bacterium]|nr:hypothetical protein [Burkholderiales bacterium]
MSLPDPRRYGNSAQSELAQLAEDGGAPLAAAVSRALERGDDAGILAAYAAAASRAAYRNLWEAVAVAVEAAPADAAVVARVFAMPWLLVCGARARTTLPGVLSDVSALTKVLEDSGALGANRNLGFANTLTDLETLERIAPSTLRAWSAGAGLRDFPPSPVVLAPGDETVHLRFLLGAAVAPAHAAGIADTATNVAAWGMRATAAVSPQLAVPGVNVLPMPRPPMSVMRAAYAGRRAGLEAAFDLFVSNTLRRFRLKVGDPAVVLSAHDSGELRVTLSSSLDDGMTEGYRWPLHPLDDVGEIAAVMEEFLRDCRVPDVSAVAEVLPDTTAAGALLFPTPAMAKTQH